MLSSPLQPRRIMTALAGQGIGHDVQVHDEIPSTSDKARELGLAGYPHGLVVFAEAQTAGRGRRESRWLSDPGLDLLVSILIRPEASPAYWPRLTTLAALAICRAVEQTSPFRPQIKWPNDVYLNGKKLAGILAETFSGPTGPFMVLGIGLNVNAELFSPDLRIPATSLKLENRRQSLPREPIAIALLQELNRQLSRWERGYPEVIADMKQRSWLLGKKIQALHQGRIVTGLAADLDTEGHLILLDERGETCVLTSAEQVSAIAAS